MGCSLRALNLSVWYAMASPSPNSRIFIEGPEFHGQLWVWPRHVDLGSSRDIASWSRAVHVVKCLT